jgi:Tol biopolymer transport system component
MAPAGLDRVVRACLDKSPDDRWQHAGDVARQLSWLATESEPGIDRTSSSDVQPTAARTEAGRSTPRGTARWPIVFAALATLLVAGDVLWRLFGASSSVVPPTAIPAHFPLRIDGVVIAGVRVSPDGRTLAIAGTREDGRAATWVQGLSDGRTVEVPNLEADVRVFGWSQDGTEIIGRSSRGVVAVRVDGWLVRPLTPSLGATVTAVGDRELLVGGEAGIRAFAFGTAAARELLSGLALRPKFLPDGRRFLYTSRADTKNQGNPDGLYLSSVDAPQERRLILSKRSSAVYASGSLLFVDGGTLFAQPFDLARAELSGTARPVLDGVRYFHPNGGSVFDAGAGTLVYETPRPDDSPVWIDRQGAIVGKLASPGLYAEPRISPDGTRAVYSRQDRRQGTGDIWLQDLATHTTVRLTNDEWSEAAMIWSQDGKTIAYGSDRDGPPDVYLQDVNGGAPQKFFATDGVDYPQSWLPDGRLVVITAGRLVVVRRDGTVDETVKVRSRGVPSPDGLWLAFSSTDGGEGGLYVEPLGGDGLRRRVAIGRVNADPVWSRDSRWLYFASNRRMMQAAVRSGPSFASEPATVVFTLDRDIASFDVSPDGQRFLVWRSPSPDFASYRALVNWPAVLK